MTTDTRDKLLDVTARIYAEGGYRGTTTRRIAQEADVNEVTIFRHFGSKDALIRAALLRLDRAVAAPIDDTSADPYARVLDWSRATHAKFFTQRAVVRRVIGDVNEHPDISPVCAEPDHDTGEIARFVLDLHERGLTSTVTNPMAASHQLISSLLLDAIWREFVPLMPPPEECVVEYVQLFFRAIGAEHLIPAEAAAAARSAAERSMTQIAAMFAGRAQP